MGKRRTAPEASQPSQRPAGCPVSFFLQILILMKIIGKIM
jgi:hypothetical protein